MIVEQFICRSDNFAVLLHDPASGLTGVIDAPDGAAILAQLQHFSWKPDFVFITHHHGDHVEGIPALKAAGATIIGPHDEQDRIPGLDRTLSDGDIFHFGAHEIKALSTPGHTDGALSYHIADAQLLFAGDTLFSLGCGRLFEGTPQTMRRSLARLKDLPDDTLLYCGHEYSESNARFALKIDPENPALRERAQEITALRQHNRMTLPVSLGREKQTNPFLRWDDPVIRAALDLKQASDDAVFAELRKLKDHF